MQNTVQNLIVALIVLYAAFVVAKKYAPKSMRRAVAKAVLEAQMRLCAPLVGGFRAAGLPGLAQRLRTHMQARVDRAVLAREAPAKSGSCGGCDSCESNGGARTASKMVNSITPDALKKTIRR